MNADDKLIKKCLRQIEEQLGWGPSEDWHSKVYSELSDRIQEQTQVLLSPTTLKRVWGRVQYTSAPSITTLNTLANFLGYINWRDFKLQHSKKKPSGVLKRVRANIAIIMLAASFMTLVFITLFSLKGSGLKEPIVPSEIVFQSRPIAEGLPNSVIFDLDISGIRSDSIYIQQYWDPTKTIKLNQNQNQATGQYYYPGYFRAKLLVDGSIVKEHDLFIKTEDWLGTIDYEPIPKYIASLKNEYGALSMPPEIMKELHASEEPLYTTFHFVQPLKPCSGDDFSLTTRLVNTFKDKWAVCQKSAVIVLGTKGALLVPLAIPGCVSDIGIMMNDVYLSGKKTDLSALGIDLSTEREVRLEVNNKELEVYLDGVSRFKGRYKESVGNIVGLRYQFLGAGEVLSLVLKNTLNNEIILQEDFSQTRPMP